ncbi:hypothetical protein BP6252_13462 [Coleophoma cylindrospora]|uniref:Uncharacterized protein n=1 Tax=Coleophoma cylindrospora TaxID=1849047 RepID=A0A3D8Q8C4_9HELO|nr:hypothetical protein BP6252_13462 [Coleophoma cylindrospora]
MLSSPRAGWCMCEHHACFHDHDPPGEVRQQTAAENTEGKTTSVNQREPATTQKPVNVQPDYGQLGAFSIGRMQTPDQSLPDTLQFDRYINSGPASNPGGLPPIPSQCLMSQATSVAGSVERANYSRPFGGLGLQTLSHISKQNPGMTAPNAVESQQHKGGLVQIYEDCAGPGFMQSLTEIATPSLRLSQEADNAATFDQNIARVEASLQKIADSRAQNSLNRALQTVDGPPGLKRSQSDTAAPVSSGAVAPDDSDYLLPRVRSIVNHVATYPITMQNHETRLDLLENTSFCNPGVDELHERHDHLDTRVVDLEGRMEEVEKAHAALNDASSHGSGHRFDESMDSRMSDASVTSNSEKAHYRSRLEALEARVSDLQALAVPSYKDPWVVEVVFLPFGARLMGVWSTKHTMTQRSRTLSIPSDDWTQTQDNSMAIAQARLTDHGIEPCWENSATDDMQAWLMPRACGVGSRVDERLRSRGLVKTVHIQGPDARDVQAAMMSAFGDLPAQIGGAHGHASLPASLYQFRGLQFPWIPLRKVHKDSCLRFLESSEMLTPALWTVPWLQSSVAMRTSTRVRRLYVTQRDSYIQHLGENVADWTWQKLRELPRVYPESQSSAEVPEADAQEACWEFDERLDPPISVHSSFTSQHSSLSIRSVQQTEVADPTSPSDHFSSAAASPVASTAPTSMIPVTRPISPLKERHPFRPLHVRTSSMSALIPAKSSPLSQGTSMSKRRIASFDHETHSSPVKMVQAVNLKRRRLSRSPSRPRDTPRWSIGPPSPYAFEDVNTMERKRGTTPFAYATPHSNAPYTDPMRYANDDEDDTGSTTDEIPQDEDYYVEENYDSDSGSDNLHDQSHQPDELWEGVEDEATEDDSFQNTDQMVLVGRDENEGYEDDNRSDISSQPSEYPSTQPISNMFAATTSAGFRIHVDDEMYEDDA